VEYLSVVLPLNHGFSVEVPLTFRGDFFRSETKMRRRVGRKCARFIWPGINPSILQVIGLSLRRSAIETGGIEWRCIKVHKVGDETTRQNHAFEHITSCPRSDKFSWEEYRSYFKRKKEFVTNLLDPTQLASSKIIISFSSSSELYRQDPLNRRWSLNYLFIYFGFWGIFPTLLPCTLSWPLTLGFI